MEKTKENNIVCPYCKKVLTAESFGAGKWRCRKCGQLLDYEKWKEFCDKENETR